MQWEDRRERRRGRVGEREGEGEGEREQEGEYAEQYLFYIHRLKSSTHPSSLLAVDQPEVKTD